MIPIEWLKRLFVKVAEDNSPAFSVSQKDLGGKTVHNKDEFVLPYATPAPKVRRAEFGERTLLRRTGPLRLLSGNRWVRQPRR